MPKVSVIIPTHNRVESLREAIRSVEAQTYTDHEIIVVDDGSTDGTPELLKRWGERITVLRQDRGGRSSARNLGIAMAKGELIAFLDDDDCWMPEKLEVQVRAAERYPDVGVIFVACRHFSGELLPSAPGPGGGDVAPRRFSGREIFRWTVLEELRDTPCLNLPSVRFLAGLPTTMMVRKCCVEKVGGFDERFEVCEDQDFCLRLATEYDFLGIPQVLAWRRIYPDQADLRGLRYAIATLDFLDFLAKAYVFSAGWISKREFRWARSNCHLRIGKQYLKLGERSKARRHFVRAFLQETPGRLRAIRLFLTTFV